MARVTCAISGITFRASHLPIVIKPEDGYFHPIFALPYKKLYGLYSKYANSELTDTDAYLLLLAFMHSTDKVRWKTPATCNPKDRHTKQLISATLPSLIHVIEVTACIHTPAFKQPTYVVDKTTASLSGLPDWIAAWEANIADFRDGYRAVRLQESIQKVENRLTYLIKAGLTPEKYAAAVADWADRVSEFPLQKKEAWKKLIRSCFNSTKMFNTPLSDIKELREYCQLNIEAGSIHFHALMDILNTGYNNNLGYLGMIDPFAESKGGGTYALLPEDITREQEEIKAILAKASEDAPKRTDYNSDFEFTRAKLRYMLAQRKISKNGSTEK